MRSGCVVGLDRSEAMLKEAAARTVQTAANLHEVRRPPDHIHLVRADGAHLPFAGVFDAVFSAATFHWIADHARLFERNRFVYPVLSRRSGGISIGVNLNPDKVCNFDCIYCQVDRTSQSETRFVEMDQLQDELRATLELVLSGAIYETDKFRDVPQHLRRLNDIAFSGDGQRTPDQPVPNEAPVDPGDTGT